MWLFLAGPLDPRRFASERRNRDSRPWIEVLSPLTHLRGARGEGGAFTGREIERFLDEVRGAPIAGTPLERLGPEPLRMRDAGAALWRASLLAAEGRGEEGQRTALETLAGLPEEIRKAVLGETPR